jgi:Zn-finger nucleic acid-binding protein
LDGGELARINKRLGKIMPIQGKGFSEFVNNVHVPYWHKRIKRKSSVTDFKNEVLPIKGATLKSSTSHVCPACSAQLNLYKIFGIEVDGCGACKGIWLDKDELRKLKDRAEKDSWTTLRWLDDEVEAIEMAQALPSKRLCPKCDGKKLISTTFGDSHIILDYCPSCHGTWLDRNEFQEIVAFLTEKLNELTSEEAKGKVYEEIKEIWTGPENIVSEILDAKATISAFINILIYENPMLCNIILKASASGRSVGL